ncbi:MAG: DUF2723 domain-containing protein [Gemmatimonadetes bacterium]|nr:DUF2723 domain-containing protein [Gemmatimonadota bacterium]
MDSRPPYDPPYRAAALAGASLFLLYLLTMSPSTAFWDTSEYIATAHIFGIPHPPGNPLFVALARVFDVLLGPLGLSVATRINVFAASTSAASIGFLFLIAHRIVSTFTPERWTALAGAGAAALLSGTAFTVWNQSTVNEKVYTVSVLVIAAVTWLGLRWYDNRDDPRSLRYALGALYLLVLGSTNHLMSILPAPALGLLVLLAGPAFLLRKEFWIRALPLVLLGLSFNMVLPIRAAQDPVINEGEPTCAGVSEALVSVWTNGKAGCPALSYNLRREQYGKPAVSQRMAPFGAQLANYYQYFDWQWSRGASASELPGTARAPFTLVFLALGLAGLYALYRADKTLFVYMGTLIGLLTIGLVFYLNFKHGYSLAPEVQDPNLHEVRERDYFFIGSFAIWGLLAGVGLVWAWTMVAGSISNPRAALATSPLLLVAIIPLALNWRWASRADDWAARDWAYDLLMSVEPYGVLFTNGDNDTFPLWYAQEVEGVRKDVTVIVGQYLHTTWYPRQLQRLSSPGRQRPFQAPEGVDVYATPERAPSSSIVAVEPALMDQVGSGPVGQDLSVPLGAIVVRYPSGTELDRSQRLALVIIRDSIGERPVYFATTSGLMTELGLNEWGVRHGLATKLQIAPFDELDAQGYTKGPPELGGERFDVARSMTLYDDVYSYRGLRDREIWNDRSTLNIPWQYYVMSLQLADALDRRDGNPQDVQRLQLDAANFQVTAEGGSQGRPGV